MELAQLRWLGGVGFGSGDSTVSVNKERGTGWPADVSDYQTTDVITGYALGGEMLNTAT